mmetsp:Transcript_40410/g.65128  ORF Transcript_40410/g.65128 Transcript_40410/m.65128 type:complete len:100 (-) Transcript_40410:693-992(-)
MPKASPVQRTIELSAETGIQNVPRNNAVKNVQTTKTWTVQELNMIMIPEPVSSSTIFQPPLRDPLFSMTLLARAWINVLSAKISGKQLKNSLLDLIFTI